MKNIKLKCVLFSLLAIFTLSVIMMSCEHEELTNDCIDESRIDIERGCLKNYKPVCGCDQVTYGNECFAEKAGVLRWQQGECPKFPKDK